MVKFPDFQIEVIKDLRKSGVIIDTKKDIDFREFFLQGRSISLRQTTGNDQPGASLPFFCHIQNTVDGLLFCILNKTAGIDEDHIRFGHILC